MAADTQRFSQATAHQQRILKRATMLFLSLATLTLAPSASAELYKWVDENGKVHFTDKPISPNAETVEVQQQKMIGQGDTVRGINDRLKRLRQSEGEAQAIEDKAHSEQKAQADKVSSRCSREKRRLGRLDGRVYRVNDKGERVYMTDAEILQTRAEVQQWLDENC